MRVPMTSAQIASLTSLDLIAVFYVYLAGDLKPLIMVNQMGYLEQLRLLVLNYNAGEYQWRQPKLGHWLLGI